MPTVFMRRVNGVVSWVKVKVNKGQELVIGGYIKSTNCFSSLLVGYYERKKLIFIAKIKNGFTPKLKRDLCDRFAEYITEECPFDNLPEPRNARRGEALTAEVMKKCTWLRPRAGRAGRVYGLDRCESSGHSRFVALRDDIDVPRFGRRIRKPSRVSHLSRANARARGANRDSV